VGLLFDFLDQVCGDEDSDSGARDFGLIIVYCGEEGLSVRSFVQKEVYDENAAGWIDIFRVLEDRGSMRVMLVSRQIYSQRPTYPIC
jgi:hypothetical protein